MPPNTGDPIGPVYRGVPGAVPILLEVFLVEKGRIVVVCGKLLSPVRELLFIKDGNDGEAGRVKIGEFGPEPPLLPICDTALSNTALCELSRSGRMLIC